MLPMHVDVNFSFTMYNESHYLVDSFLYAFPQFLAAIRVKQREITLNQSSHKNTHQVYRKYCQNFLAKATIHCILVTSYQEKLLEVSLKYEYNESPA